MSNIVVQSRRTLLLRNCSNRFNGIVTNLQKIFQAALKHGNLYKAVAKNK